jgi:hypothetical protein
MTANPKKAPRPSPNGRGLLPEDHSEIRLVPDAQRDWWLGLSKGAKAKFAEKFRTKWTDEETRELVLANSETEDYYTLGARMGRGPGALRIRRSMMVHLLRHDYDYPAKAAAYEADPKAHHKWADIAQVHRILRELGWYDLPVHEQFERARHLKQPHGGWRGDGTSHVARARKAEAEDLKARLAALRSRTADQDAGT